VNPLETASGWAPTRAEALRRLDAFAVRSGRTYASTRNYDLGPERRENVSTLSPYLRTRALLEEEVLRAVLARHSPSAAEKFVQEVFWRTYWKGWLESHPTAWTRYRETLRERLESLDTDAETDRQYRAALAGATGIEPFDSWSRELTETGYLHNHARMWFASIWIFTLGLPWELGADFFMRRLLDGDPASNTLSWRWVAGLHTRGKTYLARPSNIARYTGGRFDAVEKLATTAPPLDDAAIPARPLPALFADSAQTFADGSLVLLHDDDLGVKLPRVRNGTVRAVAGFVAANGRSPLPIGRNVRDFTIALTREAVARGAEEFGAHAGETFEFEPDGTAGADRIAALARAYGASHVIAPYAPVGPVRDALDSLRRSLAEYGLEFFEVARSFDAASWPHANRGFFNLRTRIPAILAELGITTS
jgi:deoxyribodipyrimidine photo-lyase